MSLLLCVRPGRGVSSDSEAAGDREHHAAASHGCLHPPLLHCPLHRGEEETGEGAEEAVGDGERHGILIDCTNVIGLYPYSCTYYHIQGFEMSFISASKYKDGHGT